MEIIGFQTFVFHCFYIVVGIFLPTNLKEKYKRSRLIASRQAKIDLSSKNKKSLNLGAFSDTGVSFSHYDKNFPIVRFVYKQ